MPNYKEYLSNKRHELGDRFDPSELSQQFVHYFENGARIEIDSAVFGIRRGTVGVTTGWKPSFLLMSRSNSISSPVLLSDKDQIIRVIQYK